jgi:hypothetical protein
LVSSPNAILATDQPFSREVRALARLEGWPHHPLPSFEASRNSGSHLGMTIDEEFTESP